MPPVVTRELSIIYGGTTIGGSTDFFVDGKITIEKSYETGRVACDVVIAGAASEAAFATACSDLETAFRIPRQRLRVVLGAQTLVDWNPTAGASTNTGFDAIPTIEKVGDEVDTGRSRRYRVAVQVTLPADLAGQSGRRESMVQVAWTPSRRRQVTITGTYTALAANDATAQYTAAINAYCTSVLGGLGGNYELESENYARNDTDKTLEFTRVYEELIYPQGTTGTANAPDDPELVGTVLTIVVSKHGPGDAIGRIGGSFGKPERLVTAVCAFETSVDKTVETDLNGKYTSSLKPWVLEKTAALAGFSVYALIEENVEFDNKEHRISGSCVLMGRTGGHLLEASVVVQVSETSGLVHLPVWNGDRFGHFEFQGHATKTRTVTLTTLRVQQAVNNFPAGGHNKPNEGGRGRGVISPLEGRGGGKNDVVKKLNEVVDKTQDVHVDMPALIAENSSWRPVSADLSRRPFTIGIAPNQINLVEEVQEFTEQWINRAGIGALSSRASGGSSGGAQTQSVTRNPATGA